MSVYSQYRIEYPRPPTVSASGDRLRFSLFKKSLQFAENQNRKGLGWTSGLNKFSDMVGIVLIIGETQIVSCLLLFLFYMFSTVN